MSSEKHSKKEEKKKSFWETCPKNVKHAFNLARKADPKVFVISWIVTLLTKLLPFAQFGVLGLLIDNLTEQITAVGSIAFTTELVNLIIWQVFVLSIPKIIYSARDSYQSVFRYKFLHYLQILFAKTLSSLDLGTYETPEFHDKLQKAKERGAMSYHILLAYARDIIGIFVALAIAGVVLVASHWSLLIFALVAAIPSFIVQKKFGNRTYWIWDSESQTRRMYFRRKGMLENQNPLKELKLFQMADHFIRLVDDLLVRFTDKQVTLEFKKLNWNLLASVIFIAAMAGGLYVMVDLTAKEVLTIGSLTFVLASLRQFQAELGMLFNDLGRQAEYNNFSTDFRGILETQRQLSIPENPQDIETQKAPMIEIKDLWFKYPGSDNWILKGVNLTIYAGENLAIVGINGAGKTTLVKLINRFFDPTKGKILINGIDLRDVNEEQYQSMIATLFQDYQTYKFRVRDAIALGRTSHEIDEEKVLHAARQSQADVFIQEFDEKYDQMIGKEFEGGIDLSGGQNQRMALARVFYRDAQVVILDEPTAAVDAQAEMDIFNAINEEFRDRTVITISHRFSTVRQSDKICVLKEGKVHEYGSHEELMKEKGEYANLYTKQAQAYK